MSTGRLLYVLPHPGFFTDSGVVGGHISHVTGFISAVVRRGVEVDVVGPREVHDVLSSLGVHCFGLARETLIDTLAWNARLIGIVKNLARRNRYDACYARYAARFAAHLPALKSAIGNVPLVLEVNSIGTQRHRWMRFLDVRALHAADLVVAVSRAMAAALNEMCSDDLEGKTRVLPNGVDLSRFRRGNGVPRRHGGVLKFGYVGVLKDNYGIEDLIEAYAGLRSSIAASELIIVGSGPARGRLEAMASTVNGVYFAGARKPDEIPELLQEMDVLICTSTVQHGFQSPIKLYEYLAAGRAIVAADTPQVAELFADRQVGLTYECENAEDLRAKLSLLAQDAELRAALGRAAASESIRHSWDSRVDLLWQWI